MKHLPEQQLLFCGIIQVVFFLYLYIQKLRTMFGVSRAIDGARTRGLDLGKVARYQLRHYRISG